MLRRQADCAAALVTRSEDPKTFNKKLYSEPTKWKEKSKKTEIQVGGWGEQ
jgi:hypothetical protein